MCVILLDVLELYFLSVVFVIFQFLFNLARRVTFCQIGEKRCLTVVLIYISLMSIVEHLKMSKCFLFCQLLVHVFCLFVYQVFGTYCLEGNIISSGDELLHPSLPFVLMICFLGGQVF